MRSLVIFLLSLPLFAQGVVPGRYIVELSGDPVAAHLIKQGRRAAIHSAMAREQRTQIREQQQRMRAHLEQQQAEVIEAVDTVANALVVRIPDSRAAGLRNLPGVLRVHQARRVKLLLDHALPFHNVPQSWAQIGADRAGLGIKIGMIDTGIDISHPGFQDPSLPMPQGFPKVNTDSDLALTNNKVIVARSYVYMLPNQDELSARDRVGHGTATAMAAAGIASSAPLATISGVAPKAYLGSYKVFGSSGVNDETTDDVVIKALDDAVADGMDVISMSLGNNLAPRVEDDIQVDAVERAAGLGVIVVVAAGNNGPDLNTISSPATAPSTIAVGAWRNDRVFAASAVPDGGPSYVAIPASASSSRDPISAPLADVAAIDTSGLACAPLSDGSLAGHIALILRGVCVFEQKLTNAQQAGALAALVYTDQQRPDPIVMGVGSVTLPAQMLSYADGSALKQQLATNTDLRVTLNFTRSAVTVPAERPADFSSAGPNVDLAIKPDLMAVGTNFYTATQQIDPAGGMFSSTGYILAQGTSFSTPLVAGAAALLKAARPGLTVAQYRSLLINSAAPVPAQDASIRVQQAGAGILDVDAALRSTAAVYPTALSFGAGDASPNLSRSFTISNIGTAAEMFQISSTQTDGSVLPSLTSDTVQLGPRESTTINVSLPSLVLSSGPYDGFVTILGANSSVLTRVPYWYAVNTGTPIRITILDANTSGKAGARLTNAIAFRITDASGLALTDLKPVVKVVSGGGAVLDVFSRTRLYPGVFAATVRLGAARGANVFEIQVGGLSKQFTIQAR